MSTLLPQGRTDNRNAADTTVDAEEFRLKLQAGSSVLPNREPKDHMSHCLDSQLKAGVLAKTSDLRQRDISKPRKLNSNG
jgi:hypothetical protein